MELQIASNWNCWIFWQGFLAGFVIIKLLCFGSRLDRPKICAILSQKEFFGDIYIVYVQIHDGPSELV